MTDQDYLKNLLANNEEGAQHQVARYPTYQDDERYLKIWEIRDYPD